MEVTVTIKHQTTLRDTGPCGGRNLAKGASISDAAQVFAALRNGLTVEEVRDGARSGKLPHVWQALLAPKKFHWIATEDFLATIAQVSPNRAWTDYLTSRYGGMA